MLNNWRKRAKFESDKDGEENGGRSEESGRDGERLIGIGQTARQVRGHRLQMAPAVSRAERPLKHNVFRSSVSGQPVAATNIAAKRGSSGPALAADDRSLGTCGSHVTACHRPAS